jgi:nucleoid-associated protein YgaU
MALPIHAPHPLPELPQRATRPDLRLIPGGAAAARRCRQPLAVYRRRRIAAALLASTVAVLVMAGASSLERRLTEEPAEPTPAATDAPAVIDGPTYVVQPGDTVWSIAGRLDPDGDIRPTVDRLAEAAGGTTLQPGQRIPLDAVVD